MLVNAAGRAECSARASNFLLAEATERLSPWSLLKRRLIDEASSGIPSLYHQSLAFGGNINAILSTVAVNIPRNAVDNPWIWCNIHVAANLRDIYKA